MNIPSDHRNDLPLYVYGSTEQVARIFYWFTISILISMLVGVLVSLSTNNIPPIKFLVASVPFVLFPLFLVRRERFEWAAVCLAVVLLILLTVLATVGLGIHQISNLGFPVILIVSSLVIRKRTMIFLTAFSIGCVAWLVFGELYGLFVPESLVKSVSGDFASAALSLLVTAFMVRFLTETLFKNTLLLQKELRERGLAEEKYRAIVDNSIDGIFQSTVDGKFLNVNPAMARMYGYESPQEMMRLVTDISSQIYVSSEQRDALRRQLDAEKSVAGFESQDYRKDGSTFWVSANIRAVYDENGDILYYEGTAEDITLRKNVELERQQAEDKLLQFRKLMDESNDCIFLIDPQTSRYIDFNRTVCDKLGYSREELLRIGVVNIAEHITDLEVWQKRVALVRETGGLIFESNYRRKDGTKFPTEVSARMLDYDGEKIIVANVRDITERKQVEEALRESEERFRSVFESATIGLYRTTLDGNILLANTTLARMLGFETVAELMRHDRVGDPVIVDYAQSEFLQTINTIGEVRDFETRWTRVDGVFLSVRENVKLIRDKNGDPLYFEGTVEDITERKHAERALQKNQQRLQAFFNQSLDGFFFCMFDEPQPWGDADNKEETLNYIFATQRYTDVNNAMLEQYQVTREKFLSLTSSDIFAHDPQQGLRLRRQLFDDGHLHLQTYERKSDGTPVWFEGDYVCMYDDQKRITGFFGIQRDITDRKKVESERESLIEELALKNAESETLRESLAGIVGTFEFIEILQHILDQIRHVIPYDSASVWRWEDSRQKFICGRDLPPLFQATAIEIELDVNENNSAFPILLGKVPYVLNNNVQEELNDFNQEPHTYVNSWLAIPLKTRGKIVGLIALDGKSKNQFNERHTQLAVTFANQVAIALENASLFTELQNELGEREKLIKELELKNAELERFTYTVSHDLKSPLVTINGFLGYLKGDTASGNMDRVKSDIQRIQDAVDKMHLLLRDLLELSRVGRIMNPPEKIQFESLVNDAVEIVHGRLEKQGVTVQLSPSNGTQPGLPAVYGDRQRLTEVLQNLIDNAAKYMGDQISPHIEIGQAGEDNGRAIFFVRDNGIGIDPEHHERIFGLFNKLDAKSEGTGVGLALVKRIIEIHGGRIWVDSKVGAGATFYFTLSIKSGL
ncbi:PAS domain S-box protein [Candidatus Villigracilis affinis]|uniref:PAS domain-containing sensor histidine kinase n=1 Tax=Candidatus Villigracilis affinis TaxID=3140682 RepID=UPI002A1A37A3|nr:PAS domain S-box protein [Anaerolineales bacterium]